jgi:decaprenyl-phosphate phosphoribosyltransferase
MKRLLALVNLLRPSQWIKNLFLFIPIFFAGELQNVHKLTDVAFAFVAFCCVASAIYTINDLKDIESDKQHPEKCKRPLAAGLVSPTEALLAFSLLLLCGGLCGWMIDNKFFSIVLISYFVMNIGYSLGLKRVSILEILIVASGFVFRVIGGGFVAEVEVSQWMVIMVFLLAIFLALAKRRDDFFIVTDSGKAIRKSIEHYNLEYINSLLNMISGVIIVAYLMYVISPDVMSRFHSKYLYITAVFVIAGMMRYLQITLVENRSGSPTKILYRDNFIRIVLVLWITTFYLIIY